VLLLSEKMRKVYEDKAMSSQKPSQTPPPGGSGGTAPTPAPPAAAPSTPPPTPPEPVVPDESPDAEYGAPMHGKPRPSEAELAQERERVRREAEDAGQVRPPKQPPLSDTGAKPAR